MTTTPTATPELLDLDKLEALAKAAQISILRMGMNGRPNDYIALMNAMSPEAVLALIALARRAQPEGEAPQAEPVARVIAGEWGKKIAFLANGKDAPKVGTLLYTHPPAASLSPLCGAEHAQSGKETAQLSIGFANNDQGVHVSVMQQHSDGAVTLLHQAKVPAGDSFTRFAVAAQQAAAPGALYSYMGESGRYELIGQAVGAGKCRLIDPLTVYRDTATGSLYFRHPGDFATRMVAIDGGAPDTPEETHTAAARDVLAERQRQVSIEDWTPEHDDAHACGEIAAFAALYAMPSAARDWPATETGYGDTFGAALCPEDWQPKFGDRRRELVKAGALVLAEIERLDRAAAPKGGT